MWHLWSQLPSALQEYSTSTPWMLCKSIPDVCLHRCTKWECEVLLKVHACFQNALAQKWKYTYLSLLYTVSVNMCNREATTLSLASSKIKEATGKNSFNKMETGDNNPSLWFIHNALPYYQLIGSTLSCSSNNRNTTITCYPSKAHRTFFSFTLTTCPHTQPHHLGRATGQRNLIPSFLPLQISIEHLVPIKLPVTRQEPLELEVPIATIPGR